MKRSKGFTLIELMIAIVIFALISTAAYKLMNTVTQGQQVTDGLLDDLDDMQRAKMTIEKDLFQVINRSIRNEFSDKEPALFGPSKNGFMLEFTRSGWKNPLRSTRSNLQRVAYALEDNELIRYYWPVLDRAPDPILIRQVLLTEVLELRIQYMDDKYRWLPSWPPHKEVKAGKGKDTKVDKSTNDDKHYDSLPRAIEVSLQHAIYGQITTTLPLATYKAEDNADKDKDKDKYKDEDEDEENNNNPDIWEGE